MSPIYYFAYAFGLAPYVQEHFSNARRKYFRFREIVIIVSHITVMVPLYCLQYILCDRYYYKNDYSPRNFIMFYLLYFRCFNFIANFTSSICHTNKILDAIVALREIDEIVDVRPESYRIVFTSNKLFVFLIIVTLTLPHLDIYENLFTLYDEVCLYTDMYKVVTDTIMLWYMLDILLQIGWRVKTLSILIADTLKSISDGTNSAKNIQDNLNSCFSINVNLIRAIENVNGFFQLPMLAMIIEFFLRFLSILYFKSLTGSKQETCKLSYLQRIVMLLMFLAIQHIHRQSKNNVSIS